MTRYTATFAALLASTTLAHAGGVERSTQSMAILFEEGTYAEFSFSFVNPDVSGTVGGGAVASGDITPDYTDFTLRYRQDLTDQLSFALINDSGIGADVAYPTGTGYPFAGSTGTIDSRALSAIARYEMTNGVSVYGGLRVVTLDGNVSLPPFPPAGYTLAAEGSTEVGYLFGAAYERPDIALRVSLTYQSATDHDMTATENGVATGMFPVTIPQSWTLEAQSGVAENTLVFGSIRWVDWTEFEVDGPVGPSVVSYQSDRTTFTIGGARRLSDEWTVLASVAYEAPNDDLTGNLGPTDGLTSIGLGARYETGPWRISGGLNYTFLGDATTQFPTGNPFGTFNDNTAVGAGLRVGYTF